MGAPKIASAASPWNLLTNPPCRLTVSTMTRKNSLSRLTTSAGGPGRGELGRADQVDEQDRDVAFLAAQLGAALERAAGDVLADVAAEQVPKPLPFGQIADHVVESGLQQAQFAGVVDLHVRVVVTALHFAQRPAQLAQRVGDRHRDQHRAGQPDHQREDGEQQDRRVEPLGGCGAGCRTCWPPAPARSRGPARRWTAPTPAPGAGSRRAPGSSRGRRPAAPRRRRAAAPARTAGNR